MLSKESHSHIVNIIVLVTILTQMESMFNIFTTVVWRCRRYAKGRQRKTKNSLYVITCIIIHTVPIITLLVV